MNINPTWLFLSVAALVAPAYAEITPAGQEISNDIEAFSNNIRAINEILELVKDRESADNAAKPMRQQTREMYINLRKIQERNISDTPSREDQIQLTRQVLELQLLQATFEQHCIRLAENRFYDSIQLARLFQAIANIYQRQQLMEQQQQKK